MEKLLLNLKIINEFEYELFMGAVYVSVVVVMLFNFNKNPYKKWKKQRGEVYSIMFNYKKIRFWDYVLLFT